jgi:hypothetical protein
MGIKVEPNPDMARRGNLPLQVRIAENLNAFEWNGDRPLSPLVPKNARFVGGIMKITAKRSSAVLIILTKTPQLVALQKQGRVWTRLSFSTSC